MNTESTERPSLKDEKVKPREQPYRRETTGPRVSTQEPPDERDAVAGDDASDADTVTLDFPGPVNLQCGGMMHRFRKGEARCLRAVVMETDKKGREQLHWYLRHCGVRLVGDQSRARASERA